MLELAAVFRLPILKNDQVDIHIKEESFKQVIKLVLEDFRETLARKCFVYLVIILEKSNPHPSL